MSSSLYIREFDKPYNNYINVVLPMSTSTKSGDYVAQLIDLPTASTDLNIECFVNTPEPYINYAGITLNFSYIDYSYGSMNPISAEYIDSVNVNYEYSNLRAKCALVKFENNNISYYGLKNFSEYNVSLSANIPTTDNETVTYKDFKGNNVSYKVSRRSSDTYLLKANADPNRSSYPNNLYWLIVSTKVSSANLVLSNNESTRNNIYLAAVNFINYINYYNQGNRRLVGSYSVALAESSIRNQLNNAEKPVVINYPSIKFCTTDGWYPYGGKTVIEKDNQDYYAISVDSSGIENESYPIKIDATISGRIPIMARMSGGNWVLGNDSKFLIIRKSGSASLDDRDVGVQFSVDPLVETNPNAASWSSVKYFYDTSNFTTPYTADKIWNIIGSYNINIINSNIGGNDEKGYKTLYVRFQRRNQNGVNGSFDYNIQKFEFLYGVGSAIVTAVRVSSLSSV